LCHQSWQQQQQNLGCSETSTGLPVYATAVVEYFFTTWNDHVLQVLTQLSKTSVVIDVINTKHHKTYADKVGCRPPAKQLYHLIADKAVRNV
jgi:hypothetical protein